MIKNINRFSKTRWKTLRNAEERWETLKDGEEQWETARKAERWGMLNGRNGKATVQQRYSHGNGRKSKDKMYMTDLY